METQVDERRKSNRIDAFAVGLQVSNGVDREPLGIVSNLSVGGMMLITRRQLQADGILQLTIDTPVNLGIGAIPIGAKILWCTPANSPDEFWAGLETIDIAPADQAALERLIDHLAKSP
ncbi:MAG: PilZ domain-containing protein [Gammaproteobacteria bacterium]|nr:PilZ domain-containing protein [Gammaproteobacteria bacterium]